MEIGLQDLIYQVKQELLAPNPAQRAKGCLSHCFSLTGSNWRSA